MPTYTSALPRIIDGLVTLMRARTGYRSPTSAATTGVVVYDSLEYLLQDDAPAQSYVVIGQVAVNPDESESGQNFGQSGQTEGPFGTTRPRDEHGILQGVCVCQLHEADLVGAVKRSRDGAYAQLADIELVLRADPTVGGAVGNLWSFVTQQMGKSYLSGGAVTEVEWIISYRARL